MMDKPDKSKLGESEGVERLVEQITLVPGEVGTHSAQTVSDVGVQANGVAFVRPRALYHISSGTLNR